MGEENTYNGTLYFVNGDEIQKLCDVMDFEDASVTAQEAQEGPSTPLYNYEARMTFKPSPRYRKMLRRILNGWAAKGPIRERAIISARAKLFRAMLRKWSDPQYPLDDKLKSVKEG